MLNKRKLILLVVAAVAVVALIVVVVLAAVRGATDQEAATTRPQSETPVANGHASDSPDPSGYAGWTDFEPYSQLARDVATEACSWSKLGDTAQARKRYAQSGMSEELAASFTPVWATVFAAASVSSAEISCTVAAPPGVNSVTGSAGSYVWRVGITLVYQGTFVSNSSPGAQSPASATWWLTVDQATGKVVAIEQPQSGDLQIRIKE